MFQFGLLMAGTEDWMTVDEVATYLGKSSHWVYQNRIKLQIPYTSVGGTFRFHKQLVDKWLEEKTHGNNKSAIDKKSIQKIIL